MILSPPDDDQAYFFYPVPTDTLVVRPASFLTEGEGMALAVPVEVLIKGALPDACSELHDADQVRIGNIIEVALTMRRPQGAMCAAVVRPYRFYLMLDGLYEPGPYTLKVNGRVRPFAIRAPEAAEVP